MDRKGIIYARYSPRKNENNCESNEAQFDFCRKYCSENNIEVVEEFADRALSGADEDRLELWLSIEALRKDYLLIVYKLDRLARNVYLSIIIEQAVKKKRATILSISGEGTWSDTPEDCLIRGFIAIMNEYERKVISARTRAAMLRHQANGKLMGSIPQYGWKIDPNNPKRIVKNPQERIIINEIKRLHSKGLSLRKIAAELTELGYKPRKVRKIFKGEPVLVKGKWSAQTIHVILKRLKGE